MATAADLTGGLQISPIEPEQDAIELRESADALHSYDSPPDGSVPVRTGLQLFAILAGLYLALFIAALDITIVATAIPTIANRLQSSAGYTWIGGAYTLATAAASPIWSKLSDIWGRKPILLAAVALFFCSSIICALATNTAMLISGRALQGAASGGLIQMVYITTSDLFSVRRRSLYLGFTEFVWMLAGGIGPLIGGALAGASESSWRFIWWLNLPISGLTFLLLLFFLDVHDPKTPILVGIKAIDWYGSLSILGLTLMLLLGLEFGGQTFPWDSPKVICLIVFGALMSILFIWSEKKLARYPLMPLEIFAKSSNVATLALCFMHGFAFIAAEYYLPLYFQSAKEASPLHSGVLILPFIITEAVGGVAAGVLIHRTGRYRELMWIGTALMTLGTGLFVMLDANTSTAKIIGFELIGGLGSGLLFEPPLIALQAHSTQGDTATATSTFGFVRNMSLSISLVVGGVVFQNSMQIKISELARSSSLPRWLVDKLSGADATANVMLIGKLKGLEKDAVLDAFSWSLRNMWIMYTIIAFLGVVASGFVKRRVLNKEHVETKTGLKELEDRGTV